MENLEQGTPDKNIVKETLDRIFKRLKKNNEFCWQFASYSDTNSSFASIPKGEFKGANIYRGKYKKVA